LKLIIFQTVKCLAKSLAVALLSFSAFALDCIESRVEGGSQPVARAEVTLWLAGPGAPQMLAETKTRDDGQFELEFAGDSDGVGMFYLTARGANSAIALMSTLGTASPPQVRINELTTIASAWTAA
jgi:hypothetical protein